MDRRMGDSPAEAPRTEPGPGGTVAPDDLTSRTPTRLAVRPAPADEGVAPEERLEERLGETTSIDTTGTGSFAELAPRRRPILPRQAVSVPAEDERTKEDATPSKPRDGVAFQSIERPAGPPEAPDASTLTRRLTTIRRRPLREETPRGDPP